MPKPKQVVLVPKLNHVNLLAKLNQAFVVPKQNQSATITEKKIKSLLQDRNLSLLGTSPANNPLNNKAVLAIPYLRIFITHRRCFMSESCLTESLQG